MFKNNKLPTFNYHAIAIYATKKYALHYHLYAIFCDYFMHRYQTTVSIYALYELSAVKHVMTYSGIHEFTLLAFAP